MGLSVEAWLLVIVIGLGGGWFAHATGAVGGFGPATDSVLGIFGALLGTLAAPFYFENATYGSIESLLTTVVASLLTLFFAHYARQTWLVDPDPRSRREH